MSQFYGSQSAPFVSLYPSNANARRIKLQGKASSYLSSLPWVRLDPPYTSASPDVYFIRSRNAGSGLISSVQGFVVTSVVSGGINGYATNTLPTVNLYGLQPGRFLFSGGLVILVWILLLCLRVWGKTLVVCFL